jgi:hypothetical protein
MSIHESEIHMLRESVAGLSYLLSKDPVGEVKASFEDQLDSCLSRLVQLETIPHR